MLVTEANAPERLVAAFLVDEYKQRLTHLRVIWVDQGNSGLRSCTWHIEGIEVRTPAIAL